MIPPAHARPFWEGIARKELWLQRDPLSGRWTFPPRPMAPTGSAPPEWRRASGLGRLFAVTTVPGKAPCDAPMLFAAVDMDEGVRLLAPLRGLHPDEARPGTRLRLAFPAPPDPPYLFEPE